MRICCRRLRSKPPTPGIKGRLANFGGAVLAGSPGEFGKLIAEETQKWAKVIKFAGMKPG